MSYEAYKLRKIVEFDKLYAYDVIIYKQKHVFKSSAHFCTFKI